MASTGRRDPVRHRAVGRNPAVSPGPVGASCDAGRSFGLLEAGKTVFPVKTPFAARLVEANRPSIPSARSMNREPFGAWLVVLQPGGEIAPGAAAVAGSRPEVEKIMERYAFRDLADFSAPLFHGTTVISEPPAQSSRFWCGPPTRAGRSSARRPSTSRRLRRWTWRWRCISPPARSSCSARASPKPLQAAAGSGKSVADFRREAVGFGIKLFACPTALASHGVGEDE